MHLIQPAILMAVALAAALLTTSCTPATQAARDTMVAAFSGPPALIVTRDEVMARPYYQLRLDSALGSAVLLLARVTDGQEYWATSTRQVLVIENGLVRRATGFPDTLEATRFIGADPFAIGLHRIQDGATAQRRVDWMPGYRFDVTLHSRFKPRGRERVEILGEPLELLRVDEKLSSPSTRFEAINHYWVDPADGTVLMSEQQLAPGLRLQLTALRPLRRGAQP